VCRASTNLYLKINKKKKKVKKKINRKKNTSNRRNSHISPKNFETVDISSTSTPDSVTPLISNEEVIF
jgi:hypothetical protein